MPDQWIADPDQLEPYTRELVWLGVVTQLLPSYADLARLGTRFARYVNRLEPNELANRRRDFEAGLTELVHSDKGVEEVFLHLRHERLCSRAGEWWRVELATAADYMAALALALSLPGHDLMRRNTRMDLVPDTDIRRVPITDQVHSLLPLLGGTVDEDELAFSQRAEGQVMVGRIQMMVLENLFPSPVVAIPPSELDRFRNRHADLLPAFRREVEEAVDAIFGLSSGWEQRRALDRLESEFQDAIEQVERYMAESHFGRITRSPWCGLLGLIPMLDRLVSGAQAIADIADPKPAPVRSPLAYAAFVSAEATRWERRPRMVDRRNNPLLAAAFEPSE